LHVDGEEGEEVHGTEAAQEQVPGVPDRRQDHSGHRQGSPAVGAPPALVVGVEKRIRSRGGALFAECHSHSLKVTLAVNVCLCVCGAAAAVDGSNFTSRQPLDNGQSKKWLRDSLWSSKRRRRQRNSSAERGFEGKRAARQPARHTTHTGCIRTNTQLDHRK